MASHYKNNSIYSRIKRDIEKITIKFNGIIVKPSLIVGDKPGGIFKTMNDIIKKFYLIIFKIYLNTTLMKKIICKVLFYYIAFITKQNDELIKSKS